MYKLHCRFAVTRSIGAAADTFTAAFVWFFFLFLPARCRAILPSCVPHNKTVLTDQLPYSQKKKVASTTTINMLITTRPEEKRVPKSSEGGFFIVHGMYSVCIWYLSKMVCCRGCQ